ncbi:MAG: ATP-binding protein [Oceanicaulis sp.]
MLVQDVKALIENLCRFPRETEWFEFKENNAEPESIGRYISGLANAAMLANEKHAFLVFGVNDKTHEVVGTNVELKALTVGNEIFENWLARLLSPRINFEFCSAKFDGGRRVELIAIDPGYQAPVKFRSEALVRVDSVQKKLSEFPERERALWLITSRFNFESGIAGANLKQQELFEKFHIESLIEKIATKRESEAAYIDALIREKLITDNRQNGFDATNLMAILAARNLSEFPLLSNKSARVIMYQGRSKIQGLDEITGKIGIAVAFTRILDFIMGKISHKEVMRHGVRSKQYDIPEIAIREILANALIHQDLTIGGTGPKVEIFSDRVVFSNPGAPLVEPERFIDAPSRSRNEHLASYMRRAGLCEERGSGIDRALDAIERAVLPPPIFQKEENATVVTLFGPRRFSEMSRSDRLRACYQHACLRWESGDSMSNASLRKRLGMSDKQHPQASKLISEAIEERLIRARDDNQGNRNARYVPIWVS